MQVIRLSICSACRRELRRVPTSWTRGFQSSGSLFRAPPSKKRKSSGVSEARQSSFKDPPPRYVNPSPSYTQPVQSETIDEVRAVLKAGAAGWAARSIGKLRKWGLQPQPAVLLLREFVRLVRTGQVFTNEEEDRTGQLDQVLAKLNDIGMGTGSPYDAALYARFLRWAATHPIPEAADSTLSIAQLYKAVDLLHPAEAYPSARTMKRKIIMHVGPTNSGKTYGALTALAGAKLGVYAGPLRLLAHEVWRRLNDGQIAPPGAPPAGPGVSYPRACNLVTGEEVKVVADDAGLVSCTVEMAHVSAHVYDVAVLDEVQMLADPERGGAWTNAVLGLCAKELYLCGEESAVPVVERMLADTGDQLEVRRFERLTPLSVSPSIDGDLKKIRKGDCVVAFSRSRILDLKKQIEAQTPFKCTMAYGRLPPEVRAEQAALFNDPDNGYDVMVGSDAIGMGLNLKIKRVVFDAMFKWDGSKETPLSVSQTKQIAGRAGRFGMGNDAGFVTTLHSAELPLLREALSKPMEPITNARLTYSTELVSDILSALPEGTTLSTVLDVLMNAIASRAPFTFQDIRSHATAAQFVDSTLADRPLYERLTFLSIPAPWREERVVEAMVRMMRIYKTKGEVKPESVLGEDWMASLENVKMRTAKRRELIELQAAKGVLTPLAPLSPGWASSNLSILESIDKVLTAYMWLSYRNELGFPFQAEALQMRHDTMHAIEDCLEILSSGKALAPTQKRAQNRAIHRLQAEMTQARANQETLDTVRMDLPPTLHTIPPSNTANNP